MKICTLTRANIKPYGRMIDAAQVTYKKGDNGFGVIFREESTGWRIAYLVVRRRTITRLENHPNTAETFEPVRGRAVIVLAKPGRPCDIKAFYLDKPIVVRKGVWHNVAAITPRCEIKICESIKVRQAYYTLHEPISTKARS